MDRSCAPILPFYSVASDGDTTERQIYNCVFGQFRTSLRKDSVANYASTWTLFTLFVRGPYVLCSTLNIGSSVGRWCHKNRKFVAEIFKKRKICKILCAKYFE